MSSLFSSHPGAYEQLAELREARLQRTEARHRQLGPVPARPNRLRIAIATALRSSADRLAPARETNPEPRMHGDTARPTA